MNKKFNEIKLTLLQSLQALVPNSDTFSGSGFLHPFLSHYNIDKDRLEYELSVASTLLKEASPHYTISILIFIK